ncbi:MAG: extracellular solute-binding protein, partial [Anaerolineae bacterium]
AETPAPTETISQPDDSGPKVIPFFTTESDPDQIATLRELVTEYQRLHPDVEIDIIIASPSSRGRRLLTALASGADLGIFEIEPTFMTDWAEAGYLLPLDDAVAAIGRDDYVDGSLFVYDRHVYAIPYATSVYSLWVRTDLFAQAGIALPNGQNNAAINYFSTFLWQNGGDYFDCRGNVVFGEPEAFTAVQKWVELSQYTPPGSTTWGYSEQIDAYLRGRVAMVMYAGRLGVNIVDKSPELADKSVVVFPPWGPEPVTLGVWSRFAVAAGTRHQAEAKAFLQWLVSGDRLLRYDMTVPGHMIPPLQSVREMSLASDLPYVSQHRDWLAAFYSWVPNTNHPTMNMGSVRNGRFQRSDVIPPWSSTVFNSPGIVDTMLQEITLGGRDPHEAWLDAVQNMETAVSEWKKQHPDWQPPGC